MGESNDAAPLSRMTLTQRTKNLRRRQYSLPKSISKPIFYRSKLSHPLSPETPAFLLDVLVNKDDIYDSEERAVHLSIYDMTYRYDLDSCWMERLKNILKCCSPSVDDGDDESSSTSIESDEVISVTNVRSMFYVYFFLNLLLLDSNVFFQYSSSSSAICHSF